MGSEFCKCEVHQGAMKRQTKHFSDPGTHYQCFGTPVGAQPRQDKGGSCSFCTTCTTCTTCSRAELSAHLLPSLQGLLSHHMPGQPCLCSSQQDDSRLQDSSKSLITDGSGLVLAPSYSLTASSGCVLRL